jgi:hypothetical protein
LIIVALPCVSLGASNLSRWETFVGDHRLRAQKVRAWVGWEDGVEELVEAAATAWTKRAVLVRFGIPGHMHEVGVWAGAVERA